jgi:hypothetical protein
VEDLCSSIKEPEEHDHQTLCELVSHEQISESNSCTADVEQPLAGKVPTGEGSWLYLLGHDRLKKRVSLLHSKIILASWFIGNTFQICRSFCWFH